MRKVAGNAQWNHYLVLGHNHGDPRGDLYVLMILPNILYCGPHNILLNVY